MKNATKSFLNWHQIRNINNTQVSLVYILPTIELNLSQLHGIRYEFVYVCVIMFTVWVCVHDVVIRQLTAIGNSFNFYSIEHFPMMFMMDFSIYTWNNKAKTPQIEFCEIRRMNRTEWQRAHKKDEALIVTMSKYTQLNEWTNECQERETTTKNQLLYIQFLFSLREKHVEREKPYTNYSSFVNICYWFARVPLFWFRALHFHLFKITITACLLWSLAPHHKTHSHLFRINYVPFHCKCCYYAWKLWRVNESKRTEKETKTKKKKKIGCALWVWHWLWRINEKRRKIDVHDFSLRQWEEKNNIRTRRRKMMCGSSEVHIRHSMLV